MSDKVVYLAFDNPNLKIEGRDLLACKNCRNKTYVARTDMGEFPELECAACGAQIGAFGWVEGEV